MLYDDKCELPVLTAEDEVVTFGAFEVERLTPIEAGLTPAGVMRQFGDPMMTRLGTNLVMIHNHFILDDPARYITLIHLPTGNRIRISVKS